MNKLSRSFERDQPSGVEVLAFVNQPNNFKIKRFNESLNKELGKVLGAPSAKNQTSQIHLDR